MSLELAEKIANKIHKDGLLEKLVARIKELSSDDAVLEMFAFLEANNFRPKCIAKMNKMHSDDLDYMANHIVILGYAVSTSRTVRQVEDAVINPPKKKGKK